VNCRDMTACMRARAGTTFCMYATTTSLCRRPHTTVAAPPKLGTVTHLLSHSSLRVMPRSVILRLRSTPWSASYAARAAAAAAAAAASWAAVLGALGRAAGAAAGPAGGDGAGGSRARLNKACGQANK
jgi:hypothetical protein